MKAKTDAVGVHLDIREASCKLTENYVFLTLWNTYPLIHHINSQLMGFYSITYDYFHHTILRELYCVQY